MAREDLNPVEEARAVAGLVEELGLTREEVGRRVGRSRVAISNLLRLLDLPDEALALLEDGALTEGHGRALLLAEDHADRRRLARAAARRRLVGPRHRGAGARRQRGRRRRVAARRAATARSTPTRPRPPTEIADALGAALGTDVTRHARAAPATRSSWRSTRSTTPSRSRRRACGRRLSAAVQPAAYAGSVARHSRAISSVG